MDIPEPKPVHLCLFCDHPITMPWTLLCDTCYRKSKIRAAHRAGYPPSLIADAYGLSRSTIERALRNPNWPRTIRQAKTTVHYTCELCRHTSQRKGWLTVHHRNGDRLDDSPENLRVLCRKCHGLVEISKRNLSQKEKPVW